MIELILAADNPPAASSVAPEEFRRKVELSRACLSETPMESGFKELGQLDLEPGDNLPNIVLTKSAGQPAMFDQGLVTDVEVEKQDDTTRLIATVKGQRMAQPAELKITISTKPGARPNVTLVTNVTLVLKQGMRATPFICFMPAPSRP